MRLKIHRENVLFLTVLASLNGDISKEVVNSIKKIQVLSKFDETLNYSFDKYTKDAIPTKNEGFHYSSRFRHQRPLYLKRGN